MKVESGSERGSITVEASISMVFFTFVMIVLLSFINISRTQHMIQSGLNKAAFEISEYMYLYEVSGLYKLDQDIKSAGSGSLNTINNSVGNADKIFEGLEGVSKNIEAGVDAAGNAVTSAKGLDEEGFEESIKSIKQLYADSQSQGKQIGESYEALKGNFKEVADNPIAFIKGLAALGVSAGVDQLKTYIIGDLLVKPTCLKYIGANEGFQGEKEIADETLKGLYVMRGADGLDFSHSSIFERGSEKDVNLVVVYKMKVIPLIGDWEITLAQSASTRGWLGGDAR